MTEIDHARRTSFDRNAALYDLARPSYPEPLLDEISIHVSGRSMVEIGAGTGKATALFAARGYDIVAIEPGANMAAVLRGHAFPSVTIEETTFEQWGGANGSFDLVASAQAIHWVDPAVRYTKAAATLRPGGSIAWLRNEKSDLEPALRAELDLAYTQWFPRAIASRVSDAVDSVGHEIIEEMNASGLFHPAHLATFPWTQRYTAAQYLSLLDTYSDHAVLEPSLRAPLAEAITLVIERHGAIEIPYVSMLFLARRLP